jgi:ATP-dependent DNA ligase
LLRTIVPKRSRSILCAQHVGGRGRELFAAVCSQDLEGIVAKRKRSAYDPSSPLALWAKIKNPECSQARDRH